MKKKYFIKTFGCQMNQADSEKIHMLLLQSWFEKTMEYREANLVILNTCSVRQKWEDKVVGLFHEIALLNKNRPVWNHIVVWITGCMVRKTGISQKYLLKIKKRNPTKKIEYLEDFWWIFNSDDKLFPRIVNLDFTLRIEETKYLNFILTHIYGEKIWNDDKYDDYLKQAQWRENPFQASVIIQTGCDNFCSFCIVPYTRWREVSREHNEIIQEIKNLAENGTKEIMLVGQNVNSYGKQKNASFWNSEKLLWNEWIGISPLRNLLYDIDGIEWIQRIRFTSSNPHDMTRDILDAHFDLHKTCHYLHFALQSWNDEMLQKMNRKHTYTDFKNMVFYLRKKDPYFAISTDIIVGFSWETDEMFADTVKAIEECEIDFVYIARYSVRSGTLASKIYPDTISENVKTQRWHILNTILEKNVEKRGKMMIWKQEEVIIAWETNTQFYGRTRNFKEVFFDKVSCVSLWDTVKVEITWVNRWVLVGEIVWEKWIFS